MRQHQLFGFACACPRSFHAPHAQKRIREREKWHLRVKYRAVFLIPHRDVVFILCTYSTELRLQTFRITECTAHADSLSPKIARTTNLGPDQFERRNKGKHVNIARHFGVSGFGNRATKDYGTRRKITAISWAPCSPRAS